jgi:uncharacterized protein (UPF0147 family)
MDLDSLRSTPPWEWPAAAAALLLAVLEDDGAPAADRMVAAELAGDLVVVNDDIVGALLRIVGDPAGSEALRARASIALGPVLEEADTEGFDEDDPFADAPITEATFQAIQRTLHDLFHDAGTPEEVRRRILEAAVRAPEDWQSNAVRAAYYGEDAAWRLTATFCMRYIHGFEAEILAALDSSNPDIRYQALRAAGSWGIEAAWQRVVEHLRNPGTDKPLRLAAIEAVTFIRPAEAQEILHEISDADDPEIQDAIDEALAFADGEGDEDDMDEGLNGKRPML